MGLSRVTIRTKVFVAFGLVLAVTLALGGFAINRLAQVDTAARDIRDTWLPGTQIIARMSLSFEQYRIAEGRALVAASAKANRRSRRISQRARRRFNASAPPTKPPSATMRPVALRASSTTPGRSTWPPARRCWP
jgi:hypothetical protein